MRARPIIAVLAIVFFCTPVALRAVGVTARPFENRPLATFPKLSQGWGAFDQATRFFVDRLPLREQAVRANTSISEHIFHTTPDYGRAAAGALPFGAPAARKQAQPAGAGIPAKGQPGVTVLPGREGWLFLEEELGRACNLFVAWPTAMRRWQRFVQIVRDSGRRVVLVIAPDKSTMYPRFLPQRYPEKACGPAGHDRAWAAVDGARDPGVLGLRARLAPAAQDPPQEAYFRKDTHWNTKGGTIAVGAALERLNAGVRMRAGDVVRSRKPYTGDLTNLIGAPVEDRSPAWEVVRPGLPPSTETAEKLPGGGTGRLLTRAAGGPPVLRGRTLFVDDSFGEAMLDALGGYTRKLSVVQWYGPTPPASLIAAIRRSDTVILETVERDLNFKASDGGIVTRPFLAQLRRALAIGAGR